MNCNRTIWGSSPDLRDNSLSLDNGLYVEELQRYLRVIPHPDGSPRLLGTDGIYGPETRAEVTAFQQETGILPSGTVDLATWNAIVSESDRCSHEQTSAVWHCPAAAPDAPLREGDNGTAVQLVKIMLNEAARRYSNLSAVPDGNSYDDKSAASAAQLQQLCRLSANGEVDEATWNAAARLCLPQS